MIKTSLRKSIFFMLSMLLLIISCRKEEVKEAENYHAAKNNSYAENAFADIFKWVDDNHRWMEDSILGLGNSGTYVPMEGVNITYTPMDSLTYPKLLTINFGSAGVMCLDGKIRKGKIVAAITGRHNKQGTVITIIPNNFYVNEYFMEGNYKVSCTGTNSSNNLVFKDEVTGGKLISPDGTIYWECNRTREYIAGSITPWPNVFDDVYHITGGSSGTDVTGRMYLTNIVDPLVLKMSCKWITSGTLEITPEELSVRTVDYGDGDCNPKAEVTIVDKTFNFIMSW